MARASQLSDKRTRLSSLRSALLSTAAMPRNSCFTMITTFKFVSIPVRESKPRSRFLHGETRLQHHHQPAFDENQRWIELRIPKAETRVVLFTAEGQEDRIGSFSGLSFAAPMWKTLIRAAGARCGIR